MLSPSHTRIKLLDNSLLRLLERRISRPSVLRLSCLQKRVTMLPANNISRASLNTTRMSKQLPYS